MTCSKVLLAIVFIHRLFSSSTEKERRCRSLQVFNFWLMLLLVLLLWHIEVQRINNAIGMHINSHSQCNNGIHLFTRNGILCRFCSCAFEENIFFCRSYSSDVVIRFNSPRTNMHYYYYIAAECVLYRPLCIHSEETFTRYDNNKLVSPRRKFLLAFSFS